MAINGGNIQFTVGYKLDEAGIAKIRQQLTELGSMSATQIQKANPTLNLNEARASLLNIRDSVAQVGRALDNAFDPTTRVMNLERLHTSLNQLNLQQIQTSFNQAGDVGRQAFLGISKAALTSNIQLRQTNSILDKMGQTFVNTIKWSISSKAINSFTGAIQQAYGYVQHLDTSLNDIRIVTGKSAEEMEKFAVKANDAAKALGSSTTEYTEAALIYYQQGLTDDEAQARAETTIKAANVTGQTGQQVSEELTAVWNGYKVTAEETELYVDKLAAVAATTAADLEELSVGMSKVASAANNMGVDVDQLNAQLATIISVTKQAPETAGTALKTIYARIEDLKIGGEDESGVKLGDVSSTLDEVGVHILDAQGNLRDLGEVIEEIAEKWNTWTDAQQSAIAQAMAGKRQYNNLLALFDNWDMYTDALETSKNSVGTLQKQQDIYMESTAAHIQQLETEWEDLYDSVLDTDTINSVLKGLTSILDKITDIIDATGNLKGIITGFVGILGTVFSKQIANSFAPMIANINAATERTQILEQLLANVKYQQDTGAITGAAADEMSRLQNQMSRYWSLMSEEEFNASQETIREIGNWVDKREAIVEATEAMENYFLQYGDQRSQNIVTDANNQNGLRNIVDLSSSSTDAQYLIQRLEKANKSVTILNQNVKTLGVNMAKVNENTGIGITGRTLETSLNNVQKKINQIIGARDRLYRQGLIDDNQLQQSENLLNRIQQKIEVIRQDPTNNRTNSFTLAMTDDLQNLSNMVTVADGRTQQYLNTLKTGASVYQDCDIAIQGNTRSLKEQEYQQRSNIDLIAQLAGTISSLYFGINSLSNLGSIISDDELSGTEKFSQSLSAILISLPMVISGITTLRRKLLELTIAAKTVNTVSIVLIALTVAITAATAAYKVHQQQLENVANAAKDNAAVVGKLVDKSKEEKQAIDDLANSYNTLLDQRDENGKLSEEQQNEVYELVKAYGDEELIVQALSGDYDKLAESIQKVQELANSQLISDLQRGIASTQLSLQSGIIANAGTTERDKNAFDLKGYNDRHLKYNVLSSIGMGTGLLSGVLIDTFINTPLDKDTDDAYADFEEDLADLIGKTGQDIIDESGHIAYENLEDILTSDSENLNDLLNKYQDLDAATQLRELVSSNSEAIQALKDYKDELNKAELDKIGFAHLDEVKEGIQDLGSFTAQVDMLAEEALKKGLVDEYEDGAQWAKEFLGGISDEFAEYEQESYISDALLDAIIPTNEEFDEAIAQRKTHISKVLSEYSEGGNVDLNNRPEIDTQLLRDAGWDGAEGDYATLYTKSYDMGNGTYLNFTPIIVDPETGKFVDVMTPDGLDDYVNKIIEGTGTDYNNLQIGSAFGTIEEADAAATAYHELHEALHELNDSNYDDYSIFISDVATEHIENLSDAGKAYVADNIALFQALSEQGWTVDEIFENIQSDIDRMTAEDHTVKIQAIFDEGFDSKKINEKIEALFADETFDIGISQETFEHLGTDTQAMLLGDQLMSEINTINSLTNQQIEDFKKREEDIQKAIENETALLDDANKSLAEHTQVFIDSAKTTLQENFDLTPEEKQSILNEYEDIAQSMGEAYNKALEEGKDGVKAAEEIAKSASESVQQLLQQEVDDSGGIDQFLKGWGEVDNIQDDIDDFTNSISNYQAELEEIPPYERDAYKELDVWAEEIEQVNDALDDLQESYQTLQDAVEEYNSQGYINLDTLQDIMTMDSSYVASLELVNGQLQINDSTYDSIIDTKLQMLKVEATEQFMSELVALAQEGVANAAQEAEAANYSNADSIQAVIDKAKEGTTALIEFGTAYVESLGLDSAVISSEDLETTVKAYETKLSLIDSLGSQSASAILGDTSSSSSSSSSSNEPDEEEYLEREEDLYQEINDLLDEIEDKLGRIDTIQSHTWGINYANNLKTQNDLLKDQIELLEEKKDTYESDLSNQRSELESQGFTFNESGSSITNQQAVLDELYDEYNSMVDTYNAMTKDEQDTYEDTLEAKKDVIDEIEDAIDDYNDAYDNYNDTLDELLDAHYELIENEVNSFNASIDVQLELDDAKEEWNDFWYEVIEDVEDTDFGGKIAQSLGKLDTLIGTVGNQSSSEVSTLTEHLSLLTDEVNKQIASADRGGEDSMFKDDSALAKETLETYRDDLMDAVRSAKEEIDNMQDTYLDALDDMNDKINDHIDGWKDVGDHIEHNVELIKMVSGEKEYEGIAKQYEQLYQNNLTILDADRRAKEEWESKVKYYQEMLATEQEGTEMYQLYSDALDKAEDNLRDAINRLDSDLIDSLKSREEQFKNSAASISDALDKALSGGMGLDRIKNEWDLAVEDQEHYLDNVERSFNMDELDDIFTDILDSMEGRNDLQQEFLKFQDEEIDKLNQRERLTQYDIDELKARLEIKKQELALEEAQQNKSNLRLRRDSQGNYNYQYVANEDDIEDAENNVLTAKKDWYELVKKRNVETTEAVMDIRSRMAQAEQDMADATLAHDEDAWNKAHDTYITLQDRMKEYMGDAEKAKQDFFKGTADFFSDVENNTMLPMWNTTVEHLIDQWSGGGESSFIGSTTAAINELEAEQEKFSNDTTTLLNTAGVAYDELVKTGIDPTTEALEELNDTNEELNDYLEEQNDLFGDLEDSIRDAVDAYNDLEDAAVSALEAANTALTTLAETAITTVEEVSKAVTTANSAADSVRSGGSNGTGSNGTSSTTTTSKEYEAVPDPYGVAGNYAVRKKGSSNNKYIVIGTKDYLKKLGWTSNNVEGLKTGGYTGEWMKGLPDADNGRLAILHQKELVLNEADTTNILNAVDTMRDIVGTGHNNLEFNSLADSITASARMTAGVLSQIGTGMLSAISSMVNSNNSEVQNYRNMTVNADFSGVRSADAIYQALMELDNYGSQQAYSNSPTAIKRY